MAYDGTAEKAVDGNGFAFSSPFVSPCLAFSRFAFSLSLSLAFLVRYFAHSRSFSLTFVPFLRISVRYFAHLRSSSLTLARVFGQAGRQLGVCLLHTHNERRADLVAGRSMSTIFQVYFHRFQVYFHHCTVPRSTFISFGLMSFECDLVDRWTWALTRTSGQSSL